MEVVVPVSPAAAEFHIDSASTTPYVSAPSSPRGFGDFFSYYTTSAPTSPTRAAAIYRHLNSAAAEDDSDDLRRRHPRSSSVIPFDWEEIPGTPKSHHDGGDDTTTINDDDENEVDFAFEFSGQLEMGSSPLTADELFEEGKIRPLKPPPRMQQQLPLPSFAEKNSSPKSPKSPRSRIFRSPRHRGKQDDDFDPFEKAIQETTRGRNPLVTGNSRGSRRAARSHSPLRTDGGNFSGGGSGVVNNKSPAATTAEAANNTTGAAAVGANNSYARWSKKWRLRDLFLFRSASEGRANGKDHLRKYTAALSPPPQAVRLSAAAAPEDSRNTSFRSTESGGGSVGGSSRRGVPVSAHERHYTAKRAVSEELRRKTMLPYRQGLFGCLGFHNPAINSIARGFGGPLSNRGRS